MAQVSPLAAMGHRFYSMPFNYVSAFRFRKLNLVSLGNLTLKIETMNKDLVRKPKFAGLG